VNVRLVWSLPRGRFGTACVAVATAITLLAACGGGSSSRLSKPEYVRRADAICRQSNTKIDALGAPDQHDPTAQEKAIGELIDIQRTAVADLRRLPPPEADQSTLGKWLGLVNQTVDQMRAVRTALTAGDSAGVAGGNAKGRALNDQADQIARGYGLKQCSVSAGA
jgi:hypothetical protein